MPYDFRNVTVPLGQLLFRKRNERWRNEAEDADTQRRVAAENELINKRADATQRVGLAQLEAAKRFEEQQAERNRAELESAFTQDYLASLPSDDPAAAAQAVAKARLYARALTTPQGYNVLENETRRQIAEATARVREEEAKNAEVGHQVGLLQALIAGADKSVLPKGMVINPAAFNQLGKDKTPWLILEDEILRQQAAGQQSPQQPGVSAGLLDRLMGRGPSLPATVQTPQTPASVRVIQLPKR